MIRNKTEKCLNSFESCTAALSPNTAIPGVSTKRLSSLDDHGILTKLKAQSGRFRLWAANIGANLVTGASLDYRLRDAPDVAEMVGHLLDIVSIRLAHVEDPHLKYPSDDVGNLSSQSLNPSREETESLTRQQDDIIEALVQDIGRLQRLSLAIRRPGGKYAMSRVTGSQIGDADTLPLASASIERSTPAETIFLVSVRTTIDHQFPKMDQTLRQHLALMIDLRRKRLIYARTHQNTRSSEAVPRVRQPTTVLGDVEPLELQSRDKLLKSRQAFTTSVSHQFEEDLERAPPPTATSPLAGPLHVRYNSGLPDPPSIAEYQTEHRCPFCGWTLPVEEYSKERWTHHVLHDLEPYICLDKACLPARTTFARMEDWITHTHKEHARSWKCSFAHLETEADADQNLLFSSQTDLFQHLITKHESSSSKARTIARKSAFIDLSRVFQTCPFCEWLPTTSLSNIERSTVHDETLEDHTANHLVSLSSMALSRGEDLTIEGVIVDKSKVSTLQISKPTALELEDQQAEQIAAPPVETASVAIGESKSKRPSLHIALDQVQIGWISALPIEILVAETMLDEPIEPAVAFSPTNNKYTYGRIKIAGTKAYHIVAIAQLPLSTTGKVSAATVAKDMRRTFSNLKFSIMIGVASGIWTAEMDVRLGNIVVGVPDNNGSGIIQYDRDRAVKEREFVQRGNLNKAPDLLRSAAAILRRKHLRMLENFGSHMDNEGVMRYAHRQDGHNFISAAYVHHGGISCENCNEIHLRDRFHRTDLAHRVHYEAIASGDQIIKDVTFAERIQRTHNVICFEIEAAGLDVFPCLVVRGISDHADIHKNQDWHAYAAGAAAAYAKELLSVVSLTAVAELTSTGNIHCNVPRTLSPLFIGRQVLLDSMRDYLITESSRKERPIFVLQGPGGAGKSEAAIKFATEYRNSFWGIFWINAENRQSIEQGFTGIAKLHEPSLEDTTLKNVIGWLTASKESWLLILDNCDDAGIDFSKYIPPRGGAVILTTRLMSCRNLGRWENIGELEKEDATHLLAAASGFEDGDQEAFLPTTGSVMPVLGQHALALVNAGAYIKSGYCTLSEYVQLVRDEQERLKELNPAPPQYESVYTTFEIAANALASSGRHDSHLAVNLLNILAFMDCEALEEDLFIRAFDQCQWIEKCWSLVWEEVRCTSEHSESPSMYNVLDDKTGVSCKWQGRYAKIRETETAHVSEKLLSERLKDTRRLKDTGSSHPPLSGPQRRTPKHAPHADSSSMGTKFERVALEGMSAEDEHDAQKLLTEADVRDGDDAETDADEDYVYDVWHCEHLRSTGLVESWKLLRLRAACGRLAKLALIEVDDHKISMTPLVREWARTRLSVAARTVASQQARSILVLSSFLPHDAEQLRGVENVARTHVQHGRHAQAIVLLEDICRMKTLVFPSDDPGRLRDMIRLAQAYHDIGRLTEAVALLQEVLDIDASSLPSNQARRSTSLGELASVYLKLNRPSEAVSLLEEVVEIDASRLSPDDTGRLNSMESLAEAYLRLNRPTQAVSLFRKVVKIRRGLRPDDPDRLSSMKKLAEAYLDLDCPEKAVTLLKQVVNIEITYLAPDDPERLSSMDKLAEVYLELDKPFQAVKLLLEVVEINRTNSALDDLGRLIVIDRLADAYLELGIPKRAAPLLEEVVTFESSHLAEENTSRLMSVRRLAQAYLEIGTSQKVKKAVSLLEEVMNKGRATLHATSGELIHTRDLLVDAREKLRQTEQQLQLIHLIHLMHLKQEQGTLSITQLGT